MKVSIILYLFFTLLLISCGGYNNAGAYVEANADSVEEIDFFVFDLEGKFQSTPRATTLNALIDSISYITLETRKEALLPNSLLLAVIDGSMFISGNTFLSRSPFPVFQFDSLGRFVKQVTYHGRGPNEILVTWEWYANANLRQINVIDFTGKMIIVSTDNGNIYSVEIDSFQGYDRIPLNDSTFVSAQMLYREDIPTTYLYFFDRTGKIVYSKERHDELLRYNNQTTEYNQVPPYERYWLRPDYKGDAIFHDIFNDTLYCVKSHAEITPHLVFRRGVFSPRSKDKQNLEAKKKQIYLTSVMESGDHVFLEYTYDDKRWCDVWSKSDGNCLLHTNPENGMDNLYLPFSLPNGDVVELQIAYADKDNIYCVMEALDACKFLPGVKEDDNPVIVVAKLKK